MNKLLSELQQIGFTGLIPLDRDKRDGKKRWTWTHPMKNGKDWFTVILVEEGERILIERLSNPLGQEFEANQVDELMNYIRTEVIKNKIT